MKESLRHIMLHVCRKVSDRVDSKVDSGDSKDDEIKQEDYTWQASYASHNACMVVECIRLIDFARSSGLPEFEGLTCLSGDCHGGDVPWKCLVILSGTQATDAHDFTMAVEGLGRYLRHAMSISHSKQSSNVP